MIYGAASNLDLCFFLNFELNINVENISSENYNKILFFLHKISFYYFSVCTYTVFAALISTTYVDFKLLSTLINQTVVACV